MSKRVMLAAGGLVAAAFAVGNLKPLVWDMGGRTLADYVAAGGLKDRTIPAVIEGFDRHGRWNEWFRVKAAELDGVLVLSDRRPDDLAWVAEIKRQARGQDALVSSTLAFVKPTGSEGLWIFRPITTGWMRDPTELLGFAGEVGTGKTDCACLRVSRVCVVRHAEFLRCMRRRALPESMPFGAVTYRVAWNKPYADDKDRHEYPNVLTAIKAAYGEGGR